MIFDKTNMFSDAQAITGDEASDNVVNLGETGTVFGAGAPMVRDIGKGTTIPIHISVTEAFNTLTDLTVSLQVDSVENFASPKEVASKTYLLAALGVGTLSFPDYVPEGADEQFMRLYYNVGGSNPSEGKITAGIVAARQTN